MFHGLDMDECEEDTSFKVSSPKHVSICFYQVFVVKGVEND